MKIGFIGGGKVGQSFGKYLTINGFTIAGFFSLSNASAEAAASLTNSKAFTEIEDLIQASEVIFITTPDGVIPEIARVIATIPWSIQNKIFIHMSGAHSSEILFPIKEAHPQNYLYSLHPLQAFADVKKGVQDLQYTVFTIEGDRDKIDQLIQMVEACGNDYFLIQGKEKALYHAAACVASNYLVTLIDLSLKLLEASGIAPNKGYEALLPLIQASLGNIKNLGTEEALTGPIARGDVNTIQRHLMVMKDQYPNLLPLYQYMGCETTKLAEKRKLHDAKKIEEINLLWKEGDYE